ncbi:hypothetical protein ABID60_003639, partial [Bradyrhizobium sp. S3.5.5]
MRGSEFQKQLWGYVGSRGFIFDVRFNTATIMLSGASDPDYSGEDAARYCLYRRLFVLLRQQGEPSGRNRIYRLYREEGLSV